MRVAKEFINIDPILSLQKDYINFSKNYLLIILGVL